MCQDAKQISNVIWLVTVTVGVVHEWLLLLAVFNVGEYRRRATLQYRTHDFFRADNKEAMEIREWVCLRDYMCILTIFFSVVCIFKGDAYNLEGDVPIFEGDFVGG